MGDAPPRLPEEGFEPISGTEGFRCASCGGYLWPDDRSVQLHQAWHEELERRTRPPSPAAKDRALGQHLD